MLVGGFRRYWVQQGRAPDLLIVAGLAVGFYILISAIDLIQKKKE